MSYVDLLDSSKTAYPNEFETESWRKSSKEIQGNAISLANAELMLRILHGETILLSNNQAFDSVAFLRSVPELMRMDSLDRPPIALSYFKSGVVAPAEYTPEALVDLSVEYLTKKIFVFSAWVGMDDNTKIRDRMVDALRNSDESRRFISMVENVFLDLDSSIREDFRKQAHSLQKFYNYLRKLHPLEKKVVRVAGKSDRLIWKDLDDLQYSPSKGIPFEAIKKLDEKLMSQNLHGSREDRSVLYRLIEDFGIDLRRDLKDYIDISYNKKLGASVSPRGRGVYSVTDHDPNTPSSHGEQILENAETLNTEYGIVAEEALEIFLPKKTEDGSVLNVLTWDDVVDVMNEDKAVRESAYNLQDNLALYNKLDSKDPDFSKKLEEWKKITSESFESHQTLLASSLGKKIQYDSKTKSLTSFIVPGVTALGAVVGSAVGFYAQNSLFWTAAGAATASILSLKLEKMAEKSEKDKLESTAIARVREDLKRSVKLPDSHE